MEGIFNVILNITESGFIKLWIMMVKPLKKFGQNYLLDKNIIRMIVEEINPQKDDLIIEIGPGQGAITRELFEKCDNFIAVEIDSRVILFKLIEEKESVKDAVLMVQHEVAKRMTSEKRTKDYGILRVILSYFADVKYCFKVSPHVFFPKPNVDSAVVHLVFKGDLPDYPDPKIFIKIVKAAFGNRRKTLKNSFSNSIFGKEIFEGCEVNLAKRAEELDLSEFVYLAKFVQSKSAPS